VNLIKKWREWRRINVRAKDQAQLQESATALRNLEKQMTPKQLKQVREEYTDV
jgi:hypothetical protein